MPVLHRRKFEKELRRTYS